MLLADKGYDANALRAAVTAQKAWANIPPKSNRKDPICFSPHLYKARNLIERFFNKIKQFRRIATRYDKLAENYLAALKLVAVLVWLRNNESTAQDSSGESIVIHRFPVESETKDHVDANERRGLGAHA
jgi:transposase